MSVMTLIEQGRAEMVACHSGHDSNTVGITPRILFGGTSHFVIIRQKTYMTQNMKIFSLNHMCDVVVVPSEEMRSRLFHEMCRQFADRYARHLSGCLHRTCPANPDIPDEPFRFRHRPCHHWLYAPVLRSGWLNAITGYFFFQCFQTFFEILKVMA